MSGRLLVANKIQACGARRYEGRRESMNTFKGIICALIPFFVLSLMIYVCTWLWESGYPAYIAIPGIFAAMAAELGLMNLAAIRHGKWKH